MTKRELIFDWSRSEASRKDQLLSLVIVGSLFIFLYGAIKLNEPSYRTYPEERGSLIRLVDGEMAKSWSMLADENGPFPGRLDTGGEPGGTIFSEQEGLAWWRDYKVRLRPMREDDGVGRVDITPRGKLEFPALSVAAEDAAGAALGAASSASEPILIPYHSAAIAWLPEELPALDTRGLAGATENPLRFLISLREDGSLAELIPLAGTAEPAQATLEGWLRGIRFKEGSGERWFGLRIDFMNRRGNEPEPE
jgi:hypothetical protein